MSQTTTTTTITNNADLLEQRLSILRQSMEDTYYKGADGQPAKNEDDTERVFTDEEKDQIDTIVETAVQKARDSFVPYFNSLLKEISEQTEQIDMLEAELARPVPAAVASFLSKDDDGEAIADDEEEIAPTQGEDGMITIPNAAWLKSHRKSGKETGVNAYNIFTMCYMFVLQSGMPPAGTWKTYDQKPWKDLATEFNREYTTGSKKAPGKVVAKTAPAKVISVPVVGGAKVPAKGAPAAQAPVSAGTPAAKPLKDRTTAFMLWRTDYMAANKGKAPEKGMWAKVPEAESAKYTAIINAHRAKKA